MRSFFKLVAANLLAIFLFFVAIFGLFVLLIGIISTSNDKPSLVISKNSVLVFDNKSLISESPNEEKVSLFSLGNKSKSIHLISFLESIKKAKTDNDIQGISLENDFLSSGYAQTKEVRDALLDFKKSGKFILAYGNSMFQNSYYLNSVADNIYLNPSGAVELKGLSTEVTFLKDFLDKYGVKAQVIRHGKYKAAVEPFITNSISPENKEQLFTLLSDVWGIMSQEIAAGRKLDLGTLSGLTDQLVGSIPQNALASAMVDGLLQESQYKDLLYKKATSKDPSSRNKDGYLGWEKQHRISIVDYADYIENQDKSLQDGEIAVLYASGNILPGEGFDGIYAENFKKQVKELAEDTEVKAVVLRINSPGGSANASDEILYELQQLKAKKPLTVSFGDYAASGGYYIAMAGQKIYAQPNTITGSIGVFGVIPSAEELAKRNGIRTDVVQTNKNSIGISLLKDMSPEAEQIIQKSVEQTYRRFVSFVMQNRKMSFDQVDALGGGRVWSGMRAKENGLIDGIGGVELAISEAARLAKITNYKVRFYPKKLSKWERILGSGFMDNTSQSLLEAKLGKEGTQLLEMISSERKMNQLMMVFPFKIK